MNQNNDVDRIQRVLGEIVVYYPVFAGLINEAEWLLRQPRLSRASGMLVLADPGMGKSMLAADLCNRFPIDRRRSDTGGQSPCVVSISMSGARQSKAVLDRVLTATGAPIGRIRTVSDYELAVISHLQRLGCGMLILDEVQDVVGSQQSEQLRVLEIVKNLMNVLKIPVLALGTSSAATPFQADAHLAARFQPYSLPLWTKGEDLGGFLEAIEKELPLRKESDLKAESMQDALLAVSNGVTDTIMKRIRRAAVWAIVEGTERITIKSIKELRPMPEVGCLDLPVAA